MLLAFKHSTLLCQDRTKRGIVSNNSPASSAIHVMYSNIFQFLASAALKSTYVSRGLLPCHHPNFVPDEWDLESVDRVEGI